MTKRDIRTIVKAAYVIITPEGQSNDNLMMLGDIFLGEIPDITKDIVDGGEKMKMREMVKNLVDFQTSIDKPLSILHRIGYSLSNNNAIILLEEIIKILKEKRYSENDMPELAIRINSEEFLFGT